MAFYHHCADYFAHFFGLRSNRSTLEASKDVTMKTAPNQSPEVLADGHHGGHCPSAKTAVAVPVASKAWLSFPLRRMLAL